MEFDSKFLSWAHSRQQRCHPETERKAHCIPLTLRLTLRIRVRKVILLGNMKLDLLLLAGWDVVALSDQWPDRYDRGFCGRCFEVKCRPGWITDGNVGELKENKGFLLDAACFHTDVFKYVAKQNEEKQTLPINVPVCY